MIKIKIKTASKKLLADTLTPVSIYYKIRDKFSNTALLESSDYHSKDNSRSFVCVKPIASFIVEGDKIIKEYPDGKKQSTCLDKNFNVVVELQSFISEFDIENDELISGFFGYTTYDAVQYFDTIKFQKVVSEEHYIPEICYSLYKYIISIDHFKNEMTIIENLLNNEQESITDIEAILNNLNITSYTFKPEETENSNITDSEYKEMVANGKKHVFRGDVFQLVLSRQFSRKFKGDDFNVYRALRSINPSPYLFYFDYGSYKLFGSSPEAQLTVGDGKAVINPIAGTYLRTGNSEEDRRQASKLIIDPKENAEHVMLVDLARNDLSRNSSSVKVETFSEVQYYSHVIHLVSKVSAEVDSNINPYKILADTFPAGTLSGAPKYKAMQLIDKYENLNRGFYGGCIGFIGFNGELNHAIMIRTFLSKNNTLFYMAGAGIVAQSDENTELQEVNNKLGALKKAIQMAETI